MSDPLNHDDHWRRLAADLGLDIGPEPERPPAEPRMAEPAVPPPPHASPQEPDREPQAGRGRRRRPPAVEPMAERAFGEGMPIDEVPSHHREPPAGPDVEPAAEPGFDWSAAAELVEAEEAAAELVEAEEAEIEGSDVEAAAVPEINPEAAEEAGEELAEERTGKRRRRRRSRRKKGAAPLAEGEEAAESDSAPAATAEPEADDEEPVEDISTWDVPSWDELIASLYRPER